MPRLSDVLVLMTYAMIAIVAALAFDRLGLLSTQLSWLMGAVVFLIAGQVHAAAARLEERNTFQKDIHELKASNLSLLEELEEAQKRIELIEARASGSEALDLTQIVSEPVETSTSQAGADEQLIAQLIARLEEKGLSQQTPEPRLIDQQSVRSAIENNRFDLYLQPVVSLPQRRIQFYESYTRIRDDHGRSLKADEFLKTAEEIGMIGDVDTMLLFRCVQLIRGMSPADRKTGIFLNISPLSLGDETFFNNFLDFLRRQGEMTRPIIFEMSQSGFENRTATAARNMARLIDYGFRFSLDQVQDLNVDLAELQRAGIRFIKSSAQTLIMAAEGQMPIARREPGAIRPEDIGALFERYGITLIADRIEGENEVVEVLDLDVGYGQGHLFSPPRAVKSDVLDEASSPNSRRVA